MIKPDIMWDRWSSWKHFKNLPRKCVLLKISIRAFLAGHFIRADKMIYLVREFDFFVWVLLWYAIVMAHKTWKIKLYSILVVTHPVKWIYTQKNQIIRPDKIILPTHILYWVGKMILSERIIWFFFCVHPFLLVCKWLHFEQHYIFQLSWAITLADNYDIARKKSNYPPR